MATKRNYEKFNKDTPKTTASGSETCLDEVGASKKNFDFKDDSRTYPDTSVNLKFNKDEFDEVVKQTLQSEGNDFFCNIRGLNDLQSQGVSLATSFKLDEYYGAQNISDGAGDSNADNHSYSRDEQKTIERPVNYNTGQSNSEKDIQSNYARAGQPDHPSILPLPRESTNRSNKSIKPEKVEDDFDNLVKTTVFGGFAMDGLINSFFTGDGGDISFEINQSNVFSIQDDIKNAEVSFDLDEGGESRPNDYKSSDASTDGDTKAVSDLAAGLTEPGYAMEGYILRTGAGDNIADELSSSADSIATYFEAFKQHILTSENVQLDSVEFKIAGDGSLFASENNDELEPSVDKTDIEGGKVQGSSSGLDNSSTLSENDIDGLIDVSFGSHLVFDDFINESFSSADSDTSFDIDQINSLQDNDLVANPVVGFHGADSYFDSVSPQISIGAPIYTGDNAADEGVDVTYVTTDGFNIIDEEATSLTSAAANVAGNIGAYTQSIVLGANIQINSIDLTVSGGDLAQSDDDIDSLT